MNILFIVPYSPTPIRTRPYNFIKHLQKRGHFLTVAAVMNEKGSSHWVDDLQNSRTKIITVDQSKFQVFSNTISSILSNKPLQANYSWNPFLLRNIHEIVTENPEFWDVIHVEHLRGAPYGIQLKNKLKVDKIKIPIIWDSVDCISNLFEQAANSSRSFFGRWITRLELSRTKDYESRALKKFHHVLVTSKADKEYLINLAVNGSSINRTHISKISVVTNGVDLDYFSPCSPKTDSDIIIFSGKLSYHANLTAALYLIEEIMPIIWDQKPSVVLNLVGKDPPKILVSRSKSDTRIHVTGMVPDMCEYICKSRLALAPLQYGAGIQNKVLEAMACEVPVIASKTAVSALSAVDGQDYLQADDPQDYAKAAMDLLDNPTLRVRIAKSGRNYVEKHHDWNVIAEQLEEIYQDIDGFNAT